MAPEAFRFGIAAHLAVDKIRQTHEGPARLDLFNNVDSQASIISGVTNRCHFIPDLIIVRRENPSQPVSAPLSVTGVFREEKECPSLSGAVVASIPEPDCGWFADSAAQALTDVEFTLKAPLT